MKRRFVRDANGSVAIEFALTAIPFFTLLFAIFEAGMIFFASSTLEQALNDAARTIRTGQAQTASKTVAQLTTTICGNVALLSNCTSNLKLDVRVYSSFSSVTTPGVTNSSGAIDNTKLAFNMGGAGDIVLIRAFYVWSIMSPFSTGLANNTGGTRLLQSSVAFRNEPYTS
jgi:Flp pilus assembly protein TadG